MSLEKIEHIGIAVRDIDEAERKYTLLYGISAYKREDVESEHVRTSFFRMGQTKIELLQALSDESAIHRFIEKKGEGMHHIAYEVEDIHAEMERLKAQGFEFIYNIPKAGADNKLITFLHPKCSMGVLTELCQEIR